MITPSDYLAFIEDEYLEGFVRSGGAAVKFLVPLPDVEPAVIQAGARAAAERAGYEYARLDAAQTKIHFIEQVFHRLAQQVDWLGLAREMVQQTLDAMKFPRPPESPDADLITIARYNRYDPNELRRDFHRNLHDNLLQDYAMAQEFRIAMIRLCQAEVDSSPQAANTRDAVLQWLRGELRQISRLRDALIFQKIARHNARHMLFSFARWLQKLGRPGLLIDLDITRFAATTKSADGAVNYTRATVMDAYEVLRQLIDATDELTGTFVIVTCAPEFLSDESRGLAAYHALKLRIWDEVRDRHRSNPLGALIRLSSDAPALIVRHA